MGGMSRGILYTISVLLMAVSFLYLLLVISSHTSSIKTAAEGLSDIETLNSGFDSASYGMKALLTREVANITRSGFNITFEENLSTTGNTDYYADVPEFEKFMEFRSGIETSINTSEARRPRLYISPQNISVDHLPGKITFTPQNSQESAGNITGYEILARVELDTPSYYWEEISELNESDPDAMQFHLGLEGDNGTITTTKYLDKYGDSELRLVNEYNQSVMGVRIESPAVVAVNYNADIDLKIIIGLTTRASVELGQDIITVSTGQLEKTGKVTVDES